MKGKINGFRKQRNFKRIKIFTTHRSEHRRESEENKKRNADKGKQAEIQYQILGGTYDKFKRKRKEIRIGNSKVF